MSLEKFFFNPYPHNKCTPVFSWLRVLPLFNPFGRLKCFLFHLFVCLFAVISNEIWWKIEAMSQRTWVSFSYYHMDVNIAIGSMAHYYSTNEQEKSCFQWFRTSLTFVRFQKKKKITIPPTNLVYFSLNLAHNIYEWGHGRVVDLCALWYNFI